MCGSTSRQADDGKLQHLHQFFIVCVYRRARRLTHAETQAALLLTPEDLLCSSRGPMASSSAEKQWLLRLAKKTAEEGSLGGNGYYNSLVTLTGSCGDGARIGHDQSPPPVFADDLATMPPSVRINAITRVISENEYREVEIDLNRSFGDMLQASNTDQTREAIREILLAYAVHNRSVGYVQGMNFLCAMCLELLPKEDSFWLLVHMTKRLPRNFYRKAGAEECLVFQQVVAKYAPHIKTYIGEMYETTVNLFVFQWMLPLFVHATTPNMTYLLWKSLFAVEDGEGSTVSLRMHEICLRLLIVHGTKILEESTQVSTEPESLSGISFVKKVLQKAKNMSVQNEGKGLLWEDSSLPAIDPKWFEKTRDQEAKKVRADEVALLERKKESTDTMSLTEVPLAKLELELYSWNSDETGVGTSTKTCLNLLQFEESFLIATAMTKEDITSLPNARVKHMKENVKQTEISRQFARSLFFTLDRGERGVLDRDELLMGCILVSTLTVDEKIHRCFSVGSTLRTSGTAGEAPCYVVTKVHVLLVYGLLVKLAHDWYGMEKHEDAYKKPELLRDLFQWGDFEGISLPQFQQMLRVHTRLIICIEPPSLESESSSRNTAVAQEESIGYFKRLISIDWLGGCGGSRMRAESLVSSQGTRLSHGQSLVKIGDDGVTRSPATLLGHSEQSSNAIGDGIDSLPSQKSLRGKSDGRGFCGGGELASSGIGCVLS